MQVYGIIEPTRLYTIFITYGDGKAQGAAARTVIQGRRCVPYVEPGVIPNELRHTRPLHLGAVPARPRGAASVVRLGAAMRLGSRTDES